MSLNKEEVEEGIAYAKARRKLLQKEAPALRKIEMRTDHLKAISDDKGAKANDILQKINAEESKTMWFQIGRAMKGPQGGATMTVQKMTAEGIVKESTTQKETEEIIFDEMEYMFQLAMDAPISSTDLMAKLGNLPDTVSCEHGFRVLRMNFP